MLTRLITTWNRYVEADRRQLPLFPEWERAQWMRPLPAVGAALGLALLFAVWAPPEIPVNVTALTEPTADTEADEPAGPEYDLAAIPDYIKTAAKRYHLSEELITAVISVESNFDHAAVSRKGARGLMQLMPQTSALMGVRDPHDPDENIDAGASHLRAMLDTFNNDLPLALAAYNAGEQHVIRYKGIPPYPETRRFVARVLRKMGDRQGAERVMAKPIIPVPQWISRLPRPQPKVQMVSGSSINPGIARPAGGPSTMVPSGPARAERGSQVLLQEPEPQPSARGWSLAPTSEPAPTPEPTVPLAQSP